MNSHITSNKHIGRNSFWLRCLSAELKVRRKCQRRWGPLPNAASGFCRGKDASKGQQKQRKIIQHLVDSGFILAFMGLAGFEPATFETWIPTILHGRVYPKSTYSWVLRGDLSESILSQWVGCTAKHRKDNKKVTQLTQGSITRGCILLYLHQSAIFNLMTNSPSWWYLPVRGSPTFTDSSSLHQKPRGNSKPGWRSSSWSAFHVRDESDTQGTQETEKEKQSTSAKTFWDLDSWMASSD